MSSIDDIGKLVDMITDVKRFLSGDEEVDIRGAENLQRDLTSVIGSLARLENNAIARFTTLEMASKHAIKKSVVVEQEQYKKLPTKLLKGITDLVNNDKGATFWEFTHGSGTYRLIKSESTQYTLMVYTKKLNSWSDRSVFTTEKK
jgi:hypothetical protein